MPDAVDFFISYTHADGRWAEWIAWHLEAAGFTTRLMAWDFRPGTSFVREMQEAATQARRTLAVLSPAYLQSAFCAPEWEAAFVQDPTAAQHKLLPVRVAECQPSGLLARIVYVDLAGLEEPQAREKLLAGVKLERAKPTTAPAFPGGPVSVTPSRLAPVFPGRLPAVWTVPLVRNPHFTGREEALAQLERLLATGGRAAVSQPQAVHGLGGVGKTQVAAEYAWRHAADYDAVLWVLADTPGAVETNLAQMAGPRALNLPEGGVAELPVQKAAVLRWLREHGRWLVVFDSVDTEEAAAAVVGLLPDLAGGQVLLTTRRSQWPGEVGAMAVDVLEEAEAVRFLEGRTGGKAGNGALAVARALGGLPLALELNFLRKRRQRERSAC